MENNEDKVLHLDILLYVNQAISTQLRTLIESFWDREWFLEAWNKYREYILDEGAKGSKTVHYPGYIFNDYLRQEFRNNQLRKAAPTSLRPGLWKCCNCEKVFGNDSKTLPENCPKCGFQFLKRIAKEDEEW